MIGRFVEGLIDFVVGLAEVFLGLRILLRFFAANPDNHFVSWIYNSSDVLMQPFRGIFPPTVIGRDHVVDFSALFAMVIYALVGMFLVWLVGLLTPDRRTTVVKKR